MARLTFPDEGSRLLYDPATGFLLPVNTRVYLYLDAAGTQAATDLQDMSGAAITTGYVASDAYKRLPLFQGPDTGADTLYAVVGGTGPLTPVYARDDDRLDALATRVTVLESDSPSSAVQSVNGHAGPAVTVSKADIGLGNADNTSDVNKPVSTAQATADAATLTSAQTYADGKVTALVNGAPGILDTLGEIASQLQSDESAATALTTTVAGKQNVVVHGSTAGTTRPAGATVVHWIGSVAPTNAATNDEWSDTTNKLLKRWNGTAFDTFGSGAYVTVVRASGDTTGVTDQANIQAALTACNSAGGGTVVLAGVSGAGGGTGSVFYVGSSAQANGAALAQYSNTTIVLWDATLKLINAAGFPALMNANPTPSGAPVDTNLRIIGIGNAILDGNAANNPHISGNLTQWKSVPWLYVGVTGWTIRDLTVKDPSAWGFSPQNTSGGRYQRIRSAMAGATTNQSPIQVYGTNDDLVIDGITGTSPDDCVALLTYTKQQTGAFVYPTGANAYPGGNITNVTIRNVEGSWGVANTGGLTRFLCGDGGKIQRVRVENMAQNGTGYAFWFGPTTFVTTVPADFDLRDISITNVQIRAQNATPQPIFATDAPVANLRVTGLTVTGGWTKLVGNVTAPAVAHLFNLTFNDITFYDAPSATTTGDLLAFASTVSANGVTLSNIYCVQAASILNNASGGTNSNLLLRNIHIKTATQTIFRGSATDNGAADNITVAALSGATAYYSAATRLRFGPNCPILSAADATPVATKGSRLLAVAAKQLDGGAGTTGAEWMGNGTAWVKLADLGASF